MILGARIDHAHHGNSAYHALSETISFDAAVDAALEATRGDDDTLIIVTADHSHGLSMASMAKRGNPILGTV